MELKYPIKRLAIRFAEQIRGWREDGASWQKIAEELEKESAWRVENRKVILPNSIQKAWMRLPKSVTGDHVKSCDNQPVSHPHGSIEFEKIRQAKNASAGASHEKLGQVMNNYDKAPATRVVEPFQPQVERLSEHEFACRAALTRGNKSDAELGIN